MPGARGDSAWQDASEGFQDIRVTGLALAGGALLMETGGPYLWHRGPRPTDPWAFLRGGLTPPSLAVRGREAFLVDGNFQTSAQGGAPGTWTTLMEGARGKVVAGDGWQTVVLSQNDRLLCASGHCEQVPRGTLPAPIFNPMYPEMVGHDFTAGANDGDTLYLVLDSLYRSSDRGRTFGGGLPFRAAALVKHSGRLLAFGHPPSIVEYWTQRATLISSSNGGLTWHREDSAITAALGSIRFLVSRPGELLGAGDSGVFVRKDGQTAWTDLGEGLPAGIIHALAAEGDMIAVAMEGGPIWVRTLDSPVTGLSRGSRAAPGRASLPGRFKDPASGWRRLDGRALR